MRDVVVFNDDEITEERLEEKKAAKDFFFATLLREGVLLATEN